MRLRLAAGIYVLLDEHGPLYAGMARGNYGIGARLARHNVSQNQNVRDSTRFSWYSFDDVEPVPDARGWWRLDQRRALSTIGADSAIRYAEALAINLLGT